jgi:hypothetical protein
MYLSYILIRLMGRIGLGVTGWSGEEQLRAFTGFFVDF